MVRWDTASALNWKIPNSDSTDALDPALGPSLIMKFPVTFWSKKIKDST